MQGAAGESDGFGDAAADTVCIFDAQAFEQHNSEATGVPCGRESISGAVRSWSAAAAVPVARSCEATGTAEGTSALDYDVPPIVLDAVAIFGVADVSAYLSSPMIATGNVWCASYAAARGTRSKPIQGTARGYSYAGSVPRELFTAQGMAASRSLARAA